MASQLTGRQRLELTRLLRQRINIDRFMKRRTRSLLAAELGVSEVTIWASLRRDRASGQLSPEQMEYVRLMTGEREKHKKEVSEQWTIKAIAERVGVNKTTAQRYYERERFSRHP